MSKRAHKLLMDILDEKERAERAATLSWTAKDILDSYRKRVEPHGLVRVPSGANADALLVAAGITLYEGPVELYRGNTLLFGKLAPFWAVAIYRTWTVRATSTVYTREMVTELIHLLNSDEPAQVQVEAVARMSGNDGIYGWAMREMHERGIE